MRTTIIYWHCNNCTAVQERYNALCYSDRKPYDFYTCMADHPGYNDIYTYYTT